MDMALFIECRVEQISVRSSSSFCIPANVLPVLDTYFPYQVVLKVGLGFFCLEFLFLNGSLTKMKMSELIDLYVSHKNTGNKPILNYLTFQRTT